MQVKCLHPQIIVNPLAAELIARFGNYTIKGRECNLSRRSILYDFKTSFIHPKKFKIQREDIDSCFITDRSSGELYPVYLEVPCGHCDICKQSKINAFVHRCELETQSYDCLPIFLTLTYNEENKKESGVSLRDVQLFFKRLRINLSRQGYRQRIRYVLCAEYGTNTHRPHYHAILWNLQETPFLSYQEILSTIERSWSNGFILSRFVQPNDKSSFSYTAKYLCKDMVVPVGCNPPFMVSSNRGGGIGSRFLDQCAEGIIRELNTSPKFCNKFTGKCSDIYLNRYVLDRLFPSFSRSCPVGLKRDVRDYLLSYRILKDVYNSTDILQYEQETKEIIDFFGRYFYCPLLESSEIKASLVDKPSVHFRTLSLAQIRIRNAMSKGREFYDRAFFLDSVRNAFLGKLFLYESEPIDLVHRSYQFRRSRSLAKQREVL